MASQEKTILIADDEAHVTFMLAQKIGRPGVKVLVASNGEEALALAKRHVPQLIITDYQMPRLSGFDMAVRLREDPGTAPIPVLMLTARGHRLQPSELARTNIQHLIAKPFSIREILSKVEEFVRLDQLPGAKAA